MTLTQASPFTLVCEGLEYPESPKYLPDGSILLVEIKGQRLTRVTPDGQKHTVANVPGGPNGFALGPDGAAWIANNGGFDWMPVPLPNGQVLQIGTTQPADYAGGRIERVDLATGALEKRLETFSQGLDFKGFGPREPKLVTYPEALGLRGPDDLVFDRAGGYWISDWGKQRPRDVDVTGIYYVDPDGTTITEAIFPLACPNGIALSPDEGRLYTALTYTREVIYFELDGPGRIKPNPATMDGSYLLTAHLPWQSTLDSMTVDEAGNVYVALMLPHGLNPGINGGIAVISPDGKTVEFLEIAIDGKVAPLPSSLCFGGADRKTMYATCGASGMLVKCQVDVAGHPLNFNPYQ